MKKISDVGLNLIKSFEGCQLTAYNATGVEQYLTIGWGHYGPDVTPGMIITQAKADSMLIDDLNKFVSYVNNPNYVTITDQLNQNQFDALVSFCYNCGQGNLQELCKGKTAEQIAASITLYNKGGGIVLPGLVRRRSTELELFLKGDEEDMAVQIEQLQGQINTLLLTAEAHIEQINELKAKLEDQEAPKWFKDEFGDNALEGIMDTPKGPAMLWRLLALAIRIKNK